MKIKLRLLAALQFLAICCFSQNVGIGTSEPMNKMHIAGNLLVNTPTTATSMPPTVAQTKTMPGLGTQTFLLNTDSTGRLYDSGGPSGNYGIDHDGKVTIASSFNIGIEVTAETMDLNTGDSLIIKESSTGATLLAVGNGYSSTGKWIFNSSSLYINLKSNSDFNTGAGFSLLFRRLYINSSLLQDVTGIAGTALFFDAKKGVIRSGSINNSSRGQYSTGLGLDVSASGGYSTAFGRQTNASGLSSTALGSATDASGTLSTAMGVSTTASGYASTATGFASIAGGTYSTAMGIAAVANGETSIAMGSGTYASGDNSTAMGSGTAARGNNSTALGKSTDANGYAATAIGDSSLASGAISFASGFRTAASGDYSTATGYRTTASGANSTAMGQTTTASGINSTAMGQTTTANGYSSTAMGYVTTASGYASTTMGLNTSASGFSSTAMGSHTIASGDNSTAIGNHVSTNNQEGSLVIGDNSTLTVMNGAANAFRARFDGGYRFYTSAATINAESCVLPAGGNAWVTPSDYRLKEKFQQSNGEDFLNRISMMKLGSWNYISQNPLKQRHYGPMAQDFYAAFGKDNYGTIGNDTSINSADFAGVSFIAIQALEKRSSAQQQSIDNLKKENAELKKMLMQFKEQMDILTGMKNKNL